MSHIDVEDGALRIGAGSACCGRHVVVDELIVATGFRPDLSFLRELRIALDPALECPPALAPLIDPNEHSCGTVRPHGARELAQPEPGFYIAGMKSYGRAPTFLMITGYEQVRSIVADIAGDREARASVELVLPETGVCNGPRLGGAEAAPGCCGGPRPRRRRLLRCRARSEGRGRGRLRLRSKDAGASDLNTLSPGGAWRAREPLQPQRARNKPLRYWGCQSPGA